MVSFALDVSYKFLIKIKTTFEYYIYLGKWGNSSMEF